MKAFCDKCGTVGVKISIQIHGVSGSDDEYDDGYYDSADIEVKVTCPKCENVMFNVIEENMSTGCELDVEQLQEWQLEKKRRREARKRAPAISYADFLKSRNRL